MDELIRQALDILRAMWRRRWIGLAVAWVAAVVGAVVLLRMPDRFEASARVYVDTQTMLKPLLSGLAVQPDMNQQVAMLARTLMTRPNIEKLVRLADLDVTVRTTEEKERLIDRLLQEIKFAGVGRDNVYSVSFQHIDKAYAQRVVQALVSMFVESGLGNKRRDTESARRFIDDQIQHYEQRLQEAENRLKDFRLRNFGVMGGGGQDHIARMTAASEEQKKLTLELRAAEQSRDALKRELAGEEPILLPDTAGPVGPAVSPELDARIDAQRRQLDELLRKYTDEHPDVVGTRRAIERLEAQKQQEIEARRKALAARGPATVSPATNPVFQQIKISLAEAEASIASLRARAAEAQSQLDQLRASANKVPQVEAEFAQLNRDYDVLKQSYQQLVSRRESANITGEVDVNASLAEFRVIDPPRVSPKPVFPNRMALAPLALIAAIAAGIGACFVVAQMFPTFHSPRMLREIAGRPVLGSIALRPDAAAIRRKRLLHGAFAGGIGGLVAIYGAWIGWLALSVRG